jgi:hypothetical protein
MKRQLTPQDAPKIAIALGLLFALGSVGWKSAQNSSAQSEQARAELQMKRESGARIQPGDELLSPAEVDEAQNAREDADPNFQS